jgi:hypothetical protein
MSIFERSYPKESKATNAPTVITHYPGDNFCRIVATEYWSRKMIGDLSLLMPSVRLLRDDDKVIEAEFPAEWLFLEPMEDKRPGVPPFLDHAAPGMTPSEYGPYGHDDA